MEPRPLKFIASACAGKLVAGAADTVVRRVCTDSRKVAADDLFIALAGERFDGHDFVPEVVKKRVAAVMVEQDRLPGGAAGNCPTILVENTRKALGRLAGAYRTEFGLPIIAIAGSNGKTTTKELVASVLKEKFSTLSSEASFNNEIGVPLTLLNLEKNHQAAVLEAGTNHPGELAPLVEMIAPQFGVITSIGREHLEFFGDLAGVAQEEGWLAELLPPGGKLFVDGDNEWMAQIAHRSKAQLVRVGFGEQNDWVAQNARVDKQGLGFGIRSRNQAFNGDYRISLLGRHQIINALFAIAIGADLGLTPAEIQRGLSQCKPARMRLQLWELNGVRVLDDAYNANADSMVAALQTLQELPCKGRRVAVLGDMAELGAHSQAAHEEVGRRAAELGVGQLFAVGKMAPIIARGARDAGLTRVLEFADVETAAAAIKRFVKQGDLLLLKASRSTRIERIGEMLRTGGAAN